MLIVFIYDRRGGGALEWQEGVSGSSMDTQKVPYSGIFQVWK